MPACPSARPSPRSSLRPLARLAAALTVALASLASIGCGGMATYRPRPLDVDREVEIDDDDIRKAFEAKPQLPERATVAFYSLGSHDERTLGAGSGPTLAAAGGANDAELERMLAALPGVDGVYRVPAAAVTGERRYDPVYGRQESAPSIKKLRLIAARAHADILVVFDHGRQTGDVNGLVAFAPLLVPILFLPMVDARVESYLTAHVIDVRNGYFYGQIDATERGGDDYETVFGEGTTAESAQQWGRLSSAMKGRLTEMLQAERSAARTAVASQPDP